MDTMTACNLWALLRQRSHLAEDQTATLLPTCQAAYSPVEKAVSFRLNSMRS